MGNSSFKEYGGIRIKIDNRSEYFAGETMSGQIFLDIRKPFPGNAIMLHIKGREKVHWEFEETVNENNVVNDAMNQNNNNYTVYQIIHYGKHHFYNNSVVIYQFNGQYIQQGQYVFPFSFVLSQNLPPSFFYNQGTDYAKCEYRLYAKLNGFDTKIHFKHYDTFLVKSQLLNMPQTIVQDNKSDLVTCCCSNKGQAVLRCMFDKNAYIPGEQAKIFLEVENQAGQVDINEIDCEFKQQLILKAHKVKKRVKYSDSWLNTGYVPSGSNTKRFNNVVGKSNAQGVKASERAVGNDQRIISFNINQNLYLQPTFTSEWIQNTYSMKVFCNIDGCTCMACGGCCGKFPQIEVPIAVASAPNFQLQIIQQQQQQFEQQINMQYQNNWNPQVFPNAQIIFDNKNFLASDSQQQMFNYNYNLNVNMQGMNMNNNMMVQQQQQISPQPYPQQQQQQLQQPLMQNQQYNQNDKFNINFNYQQQQQPNGNFQVQEQQNQMNMNMNFNYQQQNQM